MTQGPRDALADCWETGSEWWATTLLMERASMMEDGSAEGAECTVADGANVVSVKVSE